MCFIPPTDRRSIIVSFNTINLSNKVICHAKLSFWRHTCVIYETVCVNINWFIFSKLGSNSTLLNGLPDWFAEMMVYSDVRVKNIETYLPLVLSSCCYFYCLERVPFPCIVFICTLFPLCSD